MNRLSSFRPLLAAAIALGGLAAGSAAQARSDVYFSIGVPAPVYYQPQPVYVQPQPVYVQPRPVYVQPQAVYYGPQYYTPRRGAWGDADRDGVPNIYDRDGRRHGHQLRARGDYDHDGVPNRFDRAPANPYRR